ncbi:hypothetical protein MUP77_18155 [Candidatus Bathyarchaeota archaeon]|nr:hypothetical protein [Candidatus Bathyarchaeota archaeon]
MKRKMRLISHGTLMLVAVILQFFSFLLIMGPAFFSLAENGLIQRPTLLSIVTIVHAILGGAALVTGIWIASSWHLQTSIEKCIKRKFIMRYLIVIWILALILGITLYMLLYVFA